MNQLKTFDHSMFGTLEVLIIDGKEHFPATDMAIKLGYSNPQKAIRDHCKESGCTIRSVSYPSGSKNKRFIDEGNLYRLIVRSRLPEAEKFERWVFDEVLPSIRKHGAYMTPEKIEEALLNPDTIIRLATDLKNERERRQQIEQQRKREEPYTNFGKAVSNSRTAINVGAFAKMIYDEHGIKLGRNKMFAWLRDNGYLIRSGREKNQPKQQYIEQGLFDTSVTVVNHNTKGDIQHITTLVTGKGQVKLTEKLLEEFSVMT